MVFNQPESDDNKLDAALGNYDGSAERVHMVDDDGGEEECG